MYPTIFWKNFITSLFPVNKIVVSAKSFFPEVKDKKRNLNELVESHNVWTGDEVASIFGEDLEQKILDTNNYDPSVVVERDKQLNDNFHNSVPKIVHENPRFIDQIRFAHFQSMAGNEDIMLYPSQTQRLVREGVESIAGKIRTIQVGFGDFRFNAPRVNHLHFLLLTYANKVESLIKEVTTETVYELVSFAQYYFTLLHPFYERCGRTSEELMYLLFYQTHRKSTLYISNTGWRESPLCKERQRIINSAVENFNKRIAVCLGIDEGDIRKTPDIYRAITKKYFPNRFEEIYGEKRDRPFYYTHPILEVLEMYYFAMESLLYDEIVGFDLNCPPSSVLELKTHLKEKGSKEYTFQKALK